MLIAEYAPITLLPVFLPMAISVIISANPKVTASIRYISKNIPPPYFAARYGKRQIFPNPTAEPAAARINPSLEPNPLFTPLIWLLILRIFPSAETVKAVSLSVYPSLFNFT